MAVKLGTRSAERLDGTELSDLLRLRDGDDQGFGLSGDDRLYGERGADRLFGDAGRDLLAGGSGADTLDGGADADRLQGGTGDDLLLGGEGHDRAIFAGNRADFAIVWNDDGSLTVTDRNRSDGDQGSDRLEGIETLVFGDGKLDPAQGAAAADQFRTTEDAGRIDLVDGHVIPHLAISAADLLGNDVGRGLKIASAADIDLGATRGVLLIDTAEDGSVTGLRYAPTGLDRPTVTLADGTTESGGFIPRVDSSGPDPFRDPITIDPFQALAPGETATDSFRYTATDADGNRVTAEVSLVVDGVNDSPVVFDTSMRAPNPIARAGTFTRQYAVDPEGDAVVSVRVATLPNHAFLLPDGNITEYDNGLASSTQFYQLRTPSFTGFDSYTYSAIDYEDTNTYGYLATISIEIFEV